MRLKSLIACITFVPLLTAAAEPVVLQPTSPWDVDYAANSCRLIRLFGSGKTETKLAFESDAPDEMDMLVVGKPLETYDEEVPARFLPARAKTFDGSVARSVPTGDPAILWPSVPMLPDDIAEQMEREGKERLQHVGERPPPTDLAKVAGYKAQELAFADATTALEIRTRRNRPVILQTGSLGPAIRIFQKCIRDSLKDWGVDPDVDDKIVRRVWSINPTGWLYSTDYPQSMLDSGKESQVSVRLLIDATGKVTSCTPLSHYTEAEFNKITCDRITERARFAPAELADGTKVPSYVQRRVIWRVRP